MKIYGANSTIVCTQNNNNGFIANKPFHLEGSTISNCGIAITLLNHSNSVITYSLFFNNHVSLLLQRASALFSHSSVESSLMTGYTTIEASQFSSLTINNVTLEIIFGTGITLHTSALIGNASNCFSQHPDSNNCLNSLNSNVTLTHFAAIGHPLNGASIIILNGSRMNMSDIRLSNGSGPNGGCVNAVNSEVNVNIGRFFSGSSKTGGALYLSHSSFICGNCTFSSCKSSRSGGAIYASFSTFKMIDGSIMNNNAQNSGGGIYAISSNVSLLNTTVQNNTAQMDAGGIQSISDGTVIIIGAQFLGNEARNMGGAIMVDKALSMFFLLLISITLKLIIFIQ